MTDADVLGRYEFRPLSDRACKMAGPFASREEAAAALHAADFRGGEDEADGYDGRGRFARVARILHPTERKYTRGTEPRTVCYVVEVMPAAMTPETVAFLRREDR